MEKMPSKVKLAKLLGRFTLAEIGKRFNVSYQAVQYWCRAYGLIERRAARAYAIQPCKQCGNTHRDEGEEKRAYCSAECWDARKAESRERRRLAQREFHKKLRESEPPPQVQHGRASTYNNYRCRCQACKDAKAAANASLRTARIKQEEINDHT